jgi:hypothetical protein
LDLAGGLQLLIAVLLYLLQHPYAVPGGILLAYLADPLVDRLERAGLSRTWGVVVVFSLFTLMFMALLLVLVPMLAKQLVRCTSWRRRCSTGCSTCPAVGATAWAWPMASGSSTRSRPPSASMGQTTDIVGGAAVQATASSLALIGWLANLVLIPVVGFYLLRDWDLMMAKLRSLLPRQREEQVVGLVNAMRCWGVRAWPVAGDAGPGRHLCTGLMLVGLELGLLIGMIGGWRPSCRTWASSWHRRGAGGRPVPVRWRPVSDAGDRRGVHGRAGAGRHGADALLVGDRIGLHPVAVIFAILAGGELFGLPACCWRCRWRR